jgi:hypothetical protein
MSAVALSLPKGEGGSSGFYKNKTLVRSGFTKPDTRNPKPKN